MKFTSWHGEAETYWQIRRWLVSASSLSKKFRHKWQPRLANSDAQFFLASRPACLYHHLVLSKNVLQSWSGYSWFEFLESVLVMIFPVLLNWESPNSIKNQTGKTITKWILGRSRVNYYFRGSGLRPHIFGLSFHHIRYVLEFRSKVDTIYVSAVMFQSRRMAPWKSNFLRECALFNLTEKIAGLGSGGVYHANVHEVPQSRSSACCKRHNELHVQSGQPSRHALPGPGCLEMASNMLHIWTIHIMVKPLT